MPVCSRQALLCYSAGIDLKCSDAKLNCVLHSNRAQIALQVKEYGKALSDAHAAVTFDKTHIKSSAVCKCR